MASGPVLERQYDLKLRARLMVEAIGELQGAGVEPDVGKGEGPDRREDCALLAAAARAGGRDRVGGIVLGRGEDEPRVRNWLTIAAAVPGFIGFAVGRTSFWDPLVGCKDEGHNARAGCHRDRATLPRVCRSVRGSGRGARGRRVTTVLSTREAHTCS